MGTVWLHLELEIENDKKLKLDVYKLVVFQVDRSEDVCDDSSRSEQITEEITERIIMLYNIWDTQCYVYRWYQPLEKLP